MKERFVESGNGDSLFSKMCTGYAGKAAPVFLCVLRSDAFDLA